MKQPHVSTPPSGRCTPHAPIKRLCRWLVVHPAFDPLIILFIIGSTICLALDSPTLDPESDLATTLKQLDLVWCLIFILELTFKVGARSHLTQAPTLTHTSRHAEGSAHSLPITPRPVRPQTLPSTPPHPPTR